MDATLPARLWYFLLRAGTGFGLIRRLGCLLFGQRITSMAGLTIQAAFRYRLVLVLLGLLVMAVVGLPLVIKHDGTARGFTQILLTYTLGSMTALLGFTTLWLSCGTLARDIEDCQMQMVVVKPIPRWQVWLGKWLGIVLLNAMLMGFAGVVIYGIIHWRAGKLDPEQQEILHKEVLLGRGSLIEPLQDLTATVDLAYENVRREKPEVAQMNPEEVKRVLLERFRAAERIVNPNYRRRWTFELGPLADQLKDKPLRLRMKFQSSRPTPQDIWHCKWVVGPPEDPQVTPKTYEMRVQSGAFHEFDVAPNLFDEKGVLTVEYWNRNDIAMYFSPDEGLEVLYPECGFGMNFVRGLSIILMWMGLLAAIGLAAGSYLSFPVAAFVSISVLLVGLSSSVMSEVVKDGTIYMTPHDDSAVIRTVVKGPLDHVMVPVFKYLLKVINLVQDFSPVDALSLGRSIYWKTVFMGFCQIGVLMTGLFALLGITLFYRRELATAQSQQ